MNEIVMIGAIFIVMYFFMIKPQAKKQKDLKAFRENMKAGDKKVTIGGIHVKILEINDSTVLVSCEGSSKIRFDKSAIATSSEDKLQTA